MVKFLHMSAKFDDDTSIPFSIFSFFCFVKFIHKVLKLHIFQINIKLIFDVRI